MTADVCHAVRDCHARKPAATKESILANARHTVRDCYARKSGATIECFRADARHAVRDCYAREPFATRKGGIVYFCSTGYDNLERVASTLLCNNRNHGRRSFYFSQIVATGEGLLANIHHTVRDCYVRKISTIIERVRQNGCHFIRYDE